MDSYIKYICVQRDSTLSQKIYRMFRIFERTFLFINIKGFQLNVGGTYRI